MPPIDNDDDRLITSRPNLIGSAWRFASEAMRTTFGISILGGGEAEARAMANECFERLEILENHLSRFLDGSDVWRINRMKTGETLYLGEECHECLLLAMDAYSRTGGLFDVTLGRVVEHRKSGAAGSAPPVEGRLVIHPDIPAVTCEVPGREIDLGGIGKGFALDRLAAVLAEWGAESALLTAGASTLLATGPDAWPVDLIGEGGTRRIDLRNCALSASGTGIQGNHVVDPRGTAGEDGGENGSPAPLPWKRVWGLAPNAALADAMSTAALLMDAGELAEFAALPDGPDAVWADDGTNLVEFVYFESENPRDY